MKEFHQFQEAVKKGKTLEDRRKEAFERSREQLKKASQRPERSQAKATPSERIKSGRPKRSLVKAITSLAKSAAKRLG